MRRVMASSSAEKKFIPPIVCIPLVELKINQPFSFTVASDALRRPRCCEIGICPFKVNVWSSGIYT